MAVVSAFESREPAAGLAERPRPITPSPPASRGRLSAVGIRSMRMRASPSIVSTDRLDREIYLVLEDFGARAGCAWRETDEEDTDRETVLRDIISVCLSAEDRRVQRRRGLVPRCHRGHCQRSRRRAARERLDLSPALEAFIQANA